MKTMKKHKKITATILVFFIMLILSCGVLSLFLHDREKIAKDRAYYLAEAQVSELDKTLSSYIQATDTLKILIVDSNGSIHDFDKVASQLYKNDSAFRSIQLAPDGNVQYVYPLKGNEDSFGDLFSDPDRKSEAEYARDSGETTLAGPFELYQSGLGIVVRQPIYLEKEKKKEFWGFSIVVLNIPEIFESAGLSSIENMGYDYQLWRIHPDTHKKQFILSSTKKELEEPIKIKLKVPGGTWFFSVSNHGGWMNYKEALPLSLLLFCFSLSIAALAYAFLTLNQHRKNLKDLSYHDFLTHLYNNRKLTSIFQELIRKGDTFLLIYFDIDKFKQVNDTYGHVCGDELLREIAVRLQDYLVQGDSAYRIGGDEFIVISQGEIDIDTLMDTLQKETTLDATIYHPVLSYGISHVPSDANTLKEAIDFADQKMYEMKAKQAQK